MARAKIAICSLLSALAAFPALAECPAPSRDFIKSFAAEGTHMTIALCDGSTVSVPPTAGQNGIGEDSKISADSRFVGWTPLFPKEKPSSRIPTLLMTYHGGYLMPLESDQGMIWNWKFLDGGQVVVEVGPASKASPWSHPQCYYYALDDASTGKRLGKEDCPATSQSPAWVKALDK